MTIPDFAIPGKHMTAMTPSNYQHRILAITAVFAAFFLTLGLRITSLHAGSRENRAARALERRRFERGLDVERGRIFDRNGNLLALDVTRYAVWADPGIVARKQALRPAVSLLTENLGIDPHVLVSNLGDANRRFVYPAGYGTTIGVEQAKAIEEAGIPGVFLKDVFVRSYPRGSSMSHVLGFVNLERKGAAGVEQMLDIRLRGISGMVVGELDGRRRELYERRSLKVAPRRGADIRLTLDQSIQHIVERALAVAVMEHNAAGAWAVVQRVRTGEILAMAGIPSYDPNQFRNTHPEQMRNRCIAKVYEPGSTFKVAVVASALDAGVVTPSQPFDCENGSWMYAGRPLRDYRPHGELSVADIIKKSSNIGAAKIALLLGDERIYQYLRDFGIGRPTGIELPGEQAGILAPPGSWSRLSPTRIAIGHEVAVTALQMANVVTAIANDGVLMRPYIIKKALASNGIVLAEGRPVVLGRPIGPGTASIITDMLVRVTNEDGTGRRARVDGYTVAGKTGTAQKVVAGGYADRLNIASFVGFLPAEEPEITILVVIDEPRKSARTGGAVAAPVFSEIAEHTVRYLGIPPSPAPAPKGLPSRQFAGGSIGRGSKENGSPL